MTESAYFEKITIKGDRFNSKVTQKFAITKISFYQLMPNDKLKNTYLNVTNY